jgi:hypothetical protein
LSAKQVPYSDCRELGTHVVRNLAGFQGEDVLTTGSSGAWIGEIDLDVRVKLLGLGIDLLLNVSKVNPSVLGLEETFT